MTDDANAKPHDFRLHREKMVHDYYLGIRGARLRHAALAVLIAVGSCSMDERWTCRKGRHRLDPSVTKKSLGDAMRYECAKGRAMRIGYGVYRIGERRLVEQLRAQRLLAAHEAEAAPLPDAVDIL